MKFYPALAVAALSSVTGLAHAQATVEIFGIADIGILSTSASGSGSLTSLNGDGNTSSRLGFRGTEDLGGGLKATFHLEGAVNYDNGSAGTTNLNNKDANVGGSGFTFGRRSTIGVASRTMGEVRLGRDYVPSFSNLTTSGHPFGTNGVGNAGQMYYQVNAGGTSVRTNVRASNSISYFTPSGLGGFTGHVMYAMGEQASNAVAGKLSIKDDGNYLGARIAYTSGPLYVSFASGKTNYATGDYTQTNLAANYQFGPAKLMYLWGENKVGVTKTTANMVGTRWTVGSGEVRFAYTALTADGVANDADQWAVGYVHNLSKRTALYANISQVDNKGTGKQFTVGGGNNVTDAGGSSSGAEFGVRHSF